MSVPSYIPTVSNFSEYEWANEIKYLAPFLNETLLNLVFPVLMLAIARGTHAPETKEEFDNDYDYIIVGAGSGGATLASRLSEMPDIKVLLLEAGKTPPILTEIPTLSRGFVGTDVDWQFYTEPQNFTGNGLIDKRLNLPAGKAIGGSSIINAMIFMRGHSDIYNAWARQGATGWSYDEVLPYFKKLEHNVNPDLVEKEYHGFKGPLTVTKPKFKTPYKSAILESYANQGYFPKDINGKYQKGIYDYQSSTRRGQRCSVAKAYLIPASKRNNLHIKENSSVLKVLIKDGKAIGVRFNSSGSVHNVYAKKEVILSAGAVKTPQLLMLSGIGPKEHLEEMQIPVVSDLPVGQNFQDHITTLVPYFTHSLEPYIDRAITKAQEYVVFRRGLLSSSAVQFVSLLTNDVNSSQDSVPDYELYFLEGVDTIVKNTFNLKPEVYNQYFEPYANKSTLWCFSQNLHPKSHGFIKLRSNNPYDDPIIDPRYFSDNQDLIDVVEGMKECDRVVLTEPFRKFGVKPFETVHPGCEDFINNRTAYFICEAQSLSFSISHQSGTAKMGSLDDPSTVVDPQLRVKGVRGLRVVDASVMPLIPTSNTNVPVIMIAEKAADMIKKNLKENKEDVKEKEEDLKEKEEDVKEKEENVKEKEEDVKEKQEDVKNKEDV